MFSCRAPLPRLAIVSLGLVIAGVLSTPSRAASEGTQGTGNLMPLTMESPAPKDRPSRWIRVGRAGAAGTPTGPELRVSVGSLARKPIRVGMRFAAPDATTQCVEEAVIGPESAHRFTCPQPKLESGLDYPVEIVIRVEGRKRPVERLRLIYRFDPTQIATLQRHIDRMHTDG